MISCMFPSHLMCTAEVGCITGVPTPGPGEFQGLVSIVTRLLIDPLNQLITLFSSFFESELIADFMGKNKCRTVAHLGQT